MSDDNLDLSTATRDDLVSAIEGLVIWNRHYKDRAEKAEALLSKFYWATVEQWDPCKKLLDLLVEFNDYRKALAQKEPVK